MAHALRDIKSIWETLWIPLGVFYELIHKPVPDYNNAVRERALRKAVGLTQEALGAPLALTNSVPLRV